MSQIVGFFAGLTFLLSISTVNAGQIHGKVVDRLSGGMIAGAVVSVQGTAKAALSTNEGLSCSLTETLGIRSSSHRASGAQTELLQRQVSSIPEHRTNADCCQRARFDARADDYRRAAGKETILHLAATGLRR